MVINGQTLRNMLISATNSLDNNKVDVNNMNVFPVPDGDTGINMTLTMSTVRALEHFDGTVADCAQKVADMVLRSARGNSGAILSLFFRGMAKELKGLETATPADVARAMQVSTATVSYWETGKNLPCSRKLRQLAELFRCTVDAILSPVGEKDGRR